MQYVYNHAINDCNKGCVNWISNVKKLLNDYGFAYVFDNPSAICVNTFICEFKCRVIDTFKQEWYGNISKSTVLDMYSLFKTSIEYEKYLDLAPKNLRLYFVKLRVSVHPLRIQTGRYARNNITRNERYCLCCNDLDIEDEFHFICVCRCYSQIRKLFIKPLYYVNPSVFKFHKLLTSYNKTEIMNICKYIRNKHLLYATQLLIT